jgi:hypothetical protein
MTIKYVYQMAVINPLWPQNVPTFSISRTSEIYPNWDFLVSKYTIWQPCLKGGYRPEDHVGPEQESILTNLSFFRILFGQSFVLNFLESFHPEIAVIVF